MQMELIVGTGIGGQEKIIEAAQAARIPTRAVDVAWPRDTYVFDGERYKFANTTPSGYFGEGGYFRVGEKYILMGTGIGSLTTPHDMADFMGENGPITKLEAQEALISQAEQAYSNKRIHLIPTSSSSLYGHPHLDMSVLLVPKAQLLLVDTHFGKLAANRTEIDAVAEKEHLELIRFDGKNDGVWYPLNSCVFPLENDEVVLVDSKAKSLIKLLESRNVWVAPVEDFPQHRNPGGKINCQTNICHAGADLAELFGHSYAGRDLGLQII